MNTTLIKWLSAILVGSTLATTAIAEPLQIAIKDPIPIRIEPFHLGAASNPDGDTISLDSRSLLLNGKRWTPVMGEFHFSRYPASEWLEELHKMKAGGIDIVATYVFWIHHEEVAGDWDWSKNKNLHRFITLADEAGLKVIIRCGPWCHGEVRNGGLPDWVVEQGNTRSEDPDFLAATTKLYSQIFDQAKGLLWKDGGPVIGIQLDNEYRGPAEYLLALKSIAQSIGFDVPLYTRTGWPALTTPMPLGEIIPLYGVYAEGFWDRETSLMPGNYWSGFHFSKLRVDANIANEAFGRRDVEDPADVTAYPYLTCEIGGGMMSSYHRRILVDPRDIVSTTLVKLGSGSVSPGYYMYHGGTNPIGKLTTLMEEQRSPTTNWNDMPELNYDFQAPLSQFGQIRPHFFQLRPLHLFLQYFGERLSEMDTNLPIQRPTGKDDYDTLRWSVRSDGKSGFVFVNNHERGRTLPDHLGVQFSLQMPDQSEFVFPEKPVSIPSDCYFIWPFQLPLDESNTLEWATAQPLATSHDSDSPVTFFVPSAGVLSTFKLAGSPAFQLEPGESRNLESIRIELLTTENAELFGLKVSKSELPKNSGVTISLERPAGELRTIRFADKNKGAALAPREKDFDQAAIWRIELPEEFDPQRHDAILQLDYVGDVARFYIDDEFITDDFYNGNPLEIGLSRFADRLPGATLRLAILPLQRTAIQGEKPMIYLPEAAMPDFGEQTAVAALQKVILVPQNSLNADRE